MTFIPVPNTAEVEIRALLAGEKVENTLWFQSETPWSAAALTTLGSDVLAWWIANIIGHLPTEYQITEVFCRDHTTSSGLVASVVPASTIGGGGGVMFPGNVSFAVSFRTGHAGRSFHGRNYMCGVPESVKVTPNTVSNTYTTALRSGYLALLAPGTITGAAWVIASRFSGVDPVTKKPIPRVTGLATPVTEVAIVDNNIDSQRRRLAGRGQ